MEIAIRVVYGISELSNNGINELRQFYNHKYINKLKQKY